MWLTDVALQRAARLRAVETGTTVGAVVAEALRRYLGVELAAAPPGATSAKPPRKPKGTTPATSAAPAAVDCCANTVCRHPRTKHLGRGPKNPTACSLGACACGSFREPPAPYPN